MKIADRRAKQAANEYFKAHVMDFDENKVWIVFNTENRGVIYTHFEYIVMYDDIPCNVIVNVWNKDKRHCSAYVDYYIQQQVYAKFIGGNM